MIDVVLFKTLYFEYPDLFTTVKKKSHLHIYNPALNSRLYAFGPVQLEVFE